MLLMNTSWRIGGLAAIALFAALVSGCATRNTSPAPVEDRGRQGPTASAPAAPVAAPSAMPSTAPVAPASSAVMVSSLPAATVTVPVKNAEFAGQPGYHTVRPGDNLLRIGLEYGQRSKDIATWNDIANPNRIEVGAVLRVLPPVVSTAVATRTAVATASLPPASTRTAVAVTPAAASSPADTDISFAWPAQGTIIANFDGERALGIDIAGKLGDPVLASADGQVIYAGAGLRGYGNFIIVKHNNTFLTAYANNQTLLVKEDQLVRKGQKIAEMGQSDSDRVKLHFEIRRLGKSIDPAKMLPKL